LLLSAEKGTQTLLSRRHCPDQSEASFAVADPVLKIRRALFTLFVVLTDIVFFNDVTLL
jgi:hypothetical protein